MVKNLPPSAGDARDTGSISWSGRSPGEGNGNPLQYSCLENPRDGGACWAAIYGAAQSRTRLKWLSSSSTHKIGASLVAQMVKKSASDAADLGTIPGSGRPPGKGNSYPLQYSSLENSMDREAWPPVVHGVTKSQTWYSNWTTNSTIFAASHTFPYLVYSFWFVFR